MKWNNISPYFAPHEILSRDCVAHPHLVCEYALIMLNELREKWGDELYVNHAGMRMRGVISSAENMLRVQDGGARLSTHVQGHAFDVSPRYPIIPGHIAKLEEMALDIGFSWTQRYGTWVHVDCRNRIKL